MREEEEESHDWDIHRNKGEFSIGVKRNEGQIWRKEKKSSFPSGYIQYNIHTLVFLRRDLFYGRKGKKKKTLLLVTIQYQTQTHTDIQTQKTYKHAQPICIYNNIFQSLSLKCIVSTLYIKYNNLTFLENPLSPFSLHISLSYKPHTHIITHTTSGRNKFPYISHYILGVFFFLKKIFLTKKRTYPTHTRTHTTSDRSKFPYISIYKIFFCHPRAELPGFSQTAEKPKMVARPSPLRGNYIYTLYTLYK